KALLAVAMVFSTASATALVVVSNRGTVTTQLNSAAFLWKAASRWAEDEAGCSSVERQPTKSASGRKRIERIRRGSYRAAQRAIKPEWQWHPGANFGLRGAILPAF